MVGFEIATSWTWFIDIKSIKKNKENNYIIIILYYILLVVLYFGPLESMWNTFSVRLSRSAESATEAISLALHTVSHAGRRKLIYFFLTLIPVFI